MDSLDEGVGMRQEVAKAESIVDSGGEPTNDIVADAEENPKEGPIDSSDEEDDLAFEPFDINRDGLIVKAASQCSRASWKRPVAGWDVVITVNRFRELPPSVTAEHDASDDDDKPASKTCMNQVEPDLQLEFPLGEDGLEGFPQKICDQAKAAGVELHPLLHCGIVTMGKNERAVFVITKDADETGEDEKPKPSRRLEYDIYLDGWMEEVDLSELKDRSLVKRIVRDGDGSTQPVDIGMVTVRCRVTRKLVENLGGETVVFDNLQSQDDPVDKGEALEGPLDFVTDECPFGPGVMAIIKSMRKGEQCEALLDPSHAPVDHSEDDNFYHHVTLELVEVEQLPLVWADGEIREKMSKRFKIEGNDKFSAGDYTRALRRYNKAIRYAEGVPSGEESNGEDDGDCPSDTSQRDREGGDDAKANVTEGDPFLSLQVAILCNQAACHLKLGDGAAALDVAGRACELMPTVDSPAGIKAAYRRACALESLGVWDEARHAFKSVLGVDAKNTQCSQGLARIARAEKSYQVRLRKAFGGCLASGKLKGFASDGREVAASARRGDEQENFDGAPTAEDGPWSDESESESETLSGDESDGDETVSSEGDGGEQGPVEGRSSLVEESMSMPAGLEEPQMAATVGSAPTEEAEGGSAPASEPTGEEPTRRSSSPATDGSKDEFVIVEAPSSSSSLEEISKEPKADYAIVEEGDGTEAGEDRAGIMPPPPPHPEDDKQTKLKEEHMPDVAQGETESAVGA